jgi:hypothetical protein
MPAVFGPVGNQVFSVSAAISGPNRFRIIVGEFLRQADRRILTLSAHADQEAVSLGLAMSHPVRLASETPMRCDANARDAVMAQHGTAAPPRQCLRVTKVGRYISQVWVGED